MSASQSVLIRDGLADGAFFEAHTTGFEKTAEPSRRIRPRYIRYPRRDVVWELTQACVLACVHCRACEVQSRSPFELSAQEGFRPIMAQWK